MVHSRGKRRRASPERVPAGDSRTFLQHLGRVSEIREWFSAFCVDVCQWCASSFHALTSETIATSHPNVRPDDTVSSSLTC
eukprot:3834200-Rhodomonas_salina.1